MISFPKIHAFLFVLAMAIKSASGQIDFTPEVKEYTAEGFTHRRVTFKNDKGSVTFGPPARWTVRGDKEVLRFSPPESNFVEATVQTASLPTALVFDEAGLRVLEQQVMREVPVAAQSPQIIKRTENAVIIGPHRNFEFIISYQALGQTFHRSAIFANTPDKPLVFRFTAPKADFEKFASDFRRSLSSWNWIEKPTSVIPASAMASK
jgi:hypothetical protein